MEVFKNANGHTVYRLHRITDIALVPDDVWERNGGYVMLETAILQLKMIMAMPRMDNGSAETEELLEHLFTAFLDLTDDGKHSAATDFGDGAGIRMEIQRENAE